VTRFAVDGIDCAGKTTLADRLGALLGAARISIDDFLRTPAERYARGDSVRSSTTSGTFASGSTCRSRPRSNGRS
jgi:adenylate kinase family enzyme